MPRTAFSPEVLRARKLQMQRIKARLDRNFGSLAVALDIVHPVDFLYENVPEGATIAEYLVSLLNDVIAEEAEQLAARMAAE